MFCRAELYFDGRHAHHRVPTDRYVPIFVLAAVSPFLGMVRAASQDRADDNVAKMIGARRERRLIAKPSDSRDQCE